MSAKPASGFTASLRSNPSRRRLLQRAVGLWAPLLVFLVLSGYQLSLPGLHYDEAREAGLNAMQLLTAQPVDAFRGSGVRLAGQLFPWMVQDYIGALNSYLAIPFLAALGVGPVSLRLLGLVIAAATIVLAHRLAGHWGGPLGAGVAAWLLAVSPSFVFWSRQGIFVTNITGLLGVAAVLLAARLVAERRPWTHWFALGVLCGLGLWAKLLFVWIMGAGAIWVMLQWLWAAGRSRSGGRFWSWRGLLAGVAGLSLGLAPLLAFNWQTSGTFIAVFSNLGRSYYGVDNADFLNNVARRAAQLVDVWRGDHFWYLGGVEANPLAPWLGGALVVGAILVGAARRRTGVAGLGPVIGGIAFAAAYLAQSAFTVSDLFVTHFAAGWPLLIVAVAVSAGMLGRLGGRVGLAAVVVIVLPWLAGDLTTDVRYHAALMRSGGHSSHSDAIYTLARRLDDGTGAPVVAMDWGIDAPVRFLTAGRVRPVELFGYESLDAPNPALSESWRQFLSLRGTRFVFHVPEDTIFRGRYEALLDLARSSGLSPQGPQVIAERTGRPLFWIITFDGP